MCKCLTDCPFNLHLFDSLTQLHNVKLKIIILWFFHIRSIVVSMISCYKVTNWDVSVLPSRRQTRVLLDKVAPRMTSLKLATGKLQYLFTSILQFLNFKSHFLGTQLMIKRLTTVNIYNNKVLTKSDSILYWWSQVLAKWQRWKHRRSHVDRLRQFPVKVWLTSAISNQNRRTTGPVTTGPVTPHTTVTCQPAIVTVLVKSLDSEDQPESPLQLQTDSRGVNISGQSGIGFDYVIAELYCCESYLHIISNFAVI